MNRNYFWRFILVVLVVLWSLYEIYPHTGVDLVRYFQERSPFEKHDQLFGTIFNDARERGKTAPDKAYDNLLAAVGTNDITRYFPMYSQATNAVIKTSGGTLPSTVYILRELQKEAAGKIKLGIDLQGGTSFLVKMDTSSLTNGEEANASLISQAIEVLRKRVDAFGVSEPVIQLQGRNMILVQLPGMSAADQQEAEDRIKEAAFLEFRLVEDTSDRDIASHRILPGCEVLKRVDKLPDGKERIEEVEVPKRAEMDGSSIKRAMAVPGNFGEPQISFTLNSAGAKQFGDITRKNVGRRLAIILDGQLQSAPVIRSPIETGSGEITGQFTREEAIRLANALQNPLRTPLSVESKQQVDPTLGRDAIHSGIMASIYGVVFVALFMLVYYMTAGLVANVALVANIIILLGVMCFRHITLTLPGIAGIVLTVGMAVDANVLIYERIREESAKGKSLRGAIAAGYARAFGTIFDSHVTTLISSVILIFLGTGPIKGFGTTLTIGVAASLFTALVVTRVIFNFTLDKGRAHFYLVLLEIPLFIWLFWRITLTMTFGRGFLVFLAILASVAVLWLIARVLHKVMDGVANPGGQPRFRLEKITMLHLIPATMKLDFMKLALPAFITSWAIIAVGVGYGLTSRGKAAFSRDFVGGDSTIFSVSEKVPVDTIRAALNNAGIKDPLVQYQKDLLSNEERLRVDSLHMTNNIVQTTVTNIQQGGFVLKGQDAVGGTVGAEIRNSAIVASLLSLFGILVYVAFRYEFSFAVGAVLAVVHDVLMTIGIYYLSGRQFNATSVAAILTIIGFSTNDTIVIFDRIREDLRLGVRGTFKEVVNQALNQTLSRTIITSGTVLLATTSLFIFGGGEINDFAFTFLIGVITGTYSSIYIASALVLWWHKGQRPAIGGGPIQVEAVAAPAGK